MTQRRITPEMVLAAYEFSGIGPARGTFCKMENGKLCGCALVALWLMRERDAQDSEPPLNPQRWTQWSIEEYGEHYRNGFANGWDCKGHEPIERTPADYANGYTDGQACAAAVFGEPSNA